MMSSYLLGGKTGHLRPLMTPVRISAMPGLPNFQPVVQQKVTNPMAQRHVVPIRQTQRGLPKKAP